MDSKTSPTFVTASPGLESAISTTTAESATTHGTEALKDIACGSIAGSVGKIVEYPFDTVKVRLQSQPDRLPLRYTGPLDCFRQGIQQDGVRGLYRGVSAPLFGAAAETACLFWSYRVAQNVLRAIFGMDEGQKKERQLSLPMLVTAGAMSGGVTSLVLTPIELVKCRMQAPLCSTIETRMKSNIGTMARPTNSPISVIADVYRREGVRGFWRGQFGTLLRETGGSAAWFGSYETLSNYFKARLKNPEMETIPIWQQMVSGGVAGLGYNFLFFPADTIKSKIQTGELSHVRPTFMNVGRELWTAHGLKGLYRGCGITVARSVPSSALIFTLYEGLRKTFD